MESCCAPNYRGSFLGTESLIAPNTKRHEPHIHLRITSPQGHGMLLCFGAPWRKRPQEHDGQIAKRMVRNLHHLEAVGLPSVEVAHEADGGCSCRCEQNHPAEEKLLNFDLGRKGVSGLLPGSLAWGLGGEPERARVLVFVGGRVRRGLVYALCTGAGGRYIGTYHRGGGGVRPPLTTMNYGHLARHGHGG